MILEGLLNIIFNILIDLFEVLPNISWSVDSSAMSTFLGFISVILYMLPMDTVIALFSLILTLTIFKIGVAVIKTLWDLLPLV